MVVVWGVDGGPQYRVRVLPSGCVVGWRWVLKVRVLKVVDSGGGRGGRGDEERPKGRLENLFSRARRDTRARAALHFYIVQRSCGATKKKERETHEVNKVGTRNTAKQSTWYSTRIIDRKASARSRGLWPRGRP